jgi:RNA polymerase sigma-70 factor (ECF subfamily)
MTVSAAELVLQAQKGDRSAEAALSARFVPAIRAFARRRLRTADAVREFQQDVLVLFVEALRRGAIEDPNRVPGFVLGICRNVALERARQRERRTALLEMYGEDLVPHEQVLPPRATTEILRLEECLTSVSQRARDVVWLSYGEVLAHAEIAAKLGISEGNARVLRHRTLAALRECMSKPHAWEEA